jgi:hypothetical protein
MRVRWVVVFLLVLALDWGRSTAQEPTVPPANATSFEYGVLESDYAKEGWIYVFCRATPDGCAEDLVEPRADRRSASQPERRGRHVDDGLARVLARLGRAGWELVGETKFGALTCGDDCRVLHFKRAVYVR